VRSRGHTIAPRPQCRCRNYRLTPNTPIHFRLTMQRSLLLLCVLVTACSLPSRVLTSGVHPTAVPATPASPPAASLPVSTTLAPRPAASSAPVATAALDLTALRRQIDAQFAYYPGDWHILVKQVGGGILYSRQVAGSIDVASVIKIPIALLFFKSLESQELPSLDAYLNNRGIDDRTYGQLLHAMLVESEEPATFSLLKAMEENRLDSRATLRQWGASQTDVLLRKSSADDIVKLFEGLYAGDFITPEARQIILKEMAEYTPEDDTRTGVIRKLLPCGAQFYNKRGTITTPYLAAADVALIQFPSLAGQRAYVIAFFAYPGKDPGITYESLVQGMQVLTPIFWQAIRAQSALPAGDGCANP
jgi:hypothetical protein